MTTRIAPATWWDLALLAALCALAVLGFETSYGGANLLLAGIGGLAVGLGATVVAALLRLSALPAVLVAVVGYFLLGTPLALGSVGLFAVLPTAQSLSGLVLGAVFGWADVLTLQTPVEAPFYMAALPYFAAWVAATAGGLLSVLWLARRRTLPRSLLVLLFPLLLFVAGILIGTDEPYYAAVRGVGFALLGLVWLGRRHVRAEAFQVETDASTTRGRTAGAAVVIGGAVLLGLAAGFLAAPPPDNRFVLRDEIVPPLDPDEFTSPLAGFRQYTKLHTDDDLFTASGLVEGDRIRLATMDEYTGVLWNVAGISGERDGSGSFGLVGETLPQPGFGTAANHAQIEITIDRYDDAWLPTVGVPERLEFADDSSRAVADDLRYNASTGTALVTSGVHEGYHYLLSTARAPAPSDEQLETVPLATLQIGSVDTIPQELIEAAQEYIGEATTPIDRIRAIEGSLAREGVLSHGRESDLPSRAGHGADRMVELLTTGRLIGDQEQFASAMALMVRSLGYPARVVMGFEPAVPATGGDVTVTGDDVTAWVEVPFEGVGWVAFNPLPDERTIPNEPDPVPQFEPRPQVLQPPRQDADDDELLTEIQLEDDERRDDELFGIPTWVWVVGGVVASLALLYLVPLLVLAAVRLARRRRRRRARPDRSAAGAWSEVADRLNELGYVTPRGLSRVQLARTLEGQYAEFSAAARIRGDAATAPEPLGVEPLADAIDGDVFGESMPARQTAERRWSDADAVVERARGAAGALRRHLARFRIRTGADRTPADAFSRDVAEVSRR